MFSFAVQKLSGLMQSHLFIFDLVACALGVISPTMVKEKSVCIHTACASTLMGNSQKQHFSKMFFGGWGGWSKTVELGLEVAGKWIS